MLIVLWALGWAMIVLSVLVYLPASIVTTFGVVMIASHNLLDSVQSSQPALDHPALTQFHPEPPGACGLRWLSAHSLGGSHRGRLWPGTDL